MAGKIQLQQAFQKTYELPLVIKNILYPVFANRIKIYQSALIETSKANATELKIIKSVKCYGHIDLDDDNKVRCYEIILNPGVRLEYNKVSIQQYIRKLLTAGQAILVNFYQPEDSKVWRLSLVASDSKIIDDKIEQVKTHAKRYTYLLGPSETCRTASERFAELESLKDINLENLIKAFSVEKLSKSFFDEYKLHYQAFNSYLINSDFRRSAFSIEKQKDENAAEYKPIRDFVKKMLGRIVFLYFVQKKGWLGATNTNYTDGDTNFIMNLFHKSSGNEIFYPNYLCSLFFEALNTQRTNDLYTITYKADKKEIVCVPFLNGGLFEKEKFDNKTITFPAKLFHNKVNDEDPRYRGFLDFLNAYNFTIYEDSPDDHTIAVDPEMLGHIFENLLEDNKDKGAYYTPKEIVHYMCQESLIEYLNTKLNVFEVPFGYTGTGLKVDKPKTKPDQLLLMQTDVRDNIKRQEIEDFVKNKNANEFIFKNAKAIDGYLDAVKICDPAIGSGAFPMGLMQEIFALKMVLHDFVFAASNELFHLKDYDPKNYRSNVKLNIIQNSIYGVDIENGAVDIARLRFWLSLIVDEQIPKALPNLDYKIVAGNSLVSKFDDDVIDIDWEVQAGTQATKKLQQQIHSSLEKLFAKQKQFFNYKGDKHKLQNEIRDLKIEVLISQLELDKYKYTEKSLTSGSLFEKTAKQKESQAEISLKLKIYEAAINKLERLKQQPNKPLNFFDWKLNFPEVMNKELNADVGFDIVIGNPPYIRQESIDPKLKFIYQNKFKEVSNGTVDIYIYFFQQGMNLLKKRGVLSFITQNKWMKTKYGKEFRNVVDKNYTVDFIIDFFELKVFNEVSTDAAISQISKRMGGISNAKYYPIKSLNDYYSKTFELSFQAIKSTEQEWQFIDNSQNSILEKMEKDSISLKEYVSNKIFRGVTTGRNDVFIIDQTIRDKIVKGDNNSKSIIKKQIASTNIKKYSTTWTGDWLIFTRRGININNYPGVKSYLQQNRKKLEPKPIEFTGDWEGRKPGPYEWFEIQDNTAYYKEFEKPKIIYMHTAKKHEFYLDLDGYFVNNSCYIITSDDKYLLAYLNSKLFEWYKKIKFVAYGDAVEKGRVKLDYNKMVTIPIKRISSALKIKFESLIAKAVTNALLGKFTTEYDEQINNLVYKLYNLTYNEVKIIDPDFALSEEEYEKIKL